MIYQISYEQKTPGKDYTELYSFLENKLGEEGMHVLSDTWWIYATEPFDIKKACDDLKEYFGEYDVFYISQLNTENINGWMAHSLWNWMTKFKR